MVLMHVCFGAVQDGTLRIFEWPSMNTLLNESNAHASVKNVAFRCAFFSFQIRKKNTLLSPERGRSHLRTMIVNKTFLISDMFVLQRKW